MSDEWFDIVNREGRVIGQAPRAECHGNPGLLHRAVHVLVFNRDGNLFLQKRSPHKDVQPNRWDTSVGGHPNAGEDNATAAAREMREELGVAPNELIPAYFYIWQSEIETELITAFATRCEGPFDLDPAELSDGRFWTLDEIVSRMGRDIFTPQFEREFPRMQQWAAQNR